jgi:hypothetical protein
MQLVNDDSSVIMIWMLVRRIGIVRIAILTTRNCPIEFKAPAKYKEIKAAKLVGSAIEVTRTVVDQARIAVINGQAQWGCDRSSERK